MKKGLLSLSLATLMIGSCAVEETPVESGTITAVMEDVYTRTSVTDEGAFTWSSGDQIWIETTAKPGYVTGTLSLGAGTGSADFSYGAYVGEMTGKAFYPFNSGHDISGDQLNVVLPASYDLGSNLSNTNAAMYGVNVDGRLKFTHLAGVMRFKFKNVPVGTDKFVITLDKKINGTFTADLTDGHPVLETEATDTEAAKKITLNFDALSSVQDITLYVPLPLGTYTSLGLEVLAGTESVWTYSNIVTNTVNRKSLLLMPAVTLSGSIGGDIEGDEPPSGQQPGDYVDEYGINHGQGVKIGETVWAPVNCGYHATDYKWGKLYQWGRKYGQGYDGDLYDKHGNKIGETSDAIVPEFSEGGASLQDGQSDSNKNVFYIWLDSSSYDWLHQSDDQLWNSGTEESPVKTEYDPCPEGWRVPTYAELEELGQNHSEWTSNVNGQSGYWFSGTASYSSEVAQVFFSAAGHRGGGSLALNRGYKGPYWSSRPHNSNSAYFLNFNSYNAEILNYFRGYAHSVRCVQDTSDESIPVSSVELNLKSLNLQEGEVQQLTATVSPQDATDKSVVWSSSDASVATVDQTGRVTAVSAGSATITAVAGVKSAFCTITVSALAVATLDYIDEYGINHGQGVKIGETVWAPVNCGYHATDYKWGKLYQWGRKYGQGYDGDAYNINGFLVGEARDLLVPAVEDGGISLQVGNLQSNENVFYAGSSDTGYDWLLPHDSKLWNSGSDTSPVKTENDPCPSGWRIPTYDELDKLSFNYSDYENPAGQIGCWLSGPNSYSESVPHVFFSAAGYRSYYGSKADYRGFEGFYWSSKTLDQYAHYLHIYGGGVAVMGKSDRAYGHSVRCVQE